MSFVSNGINFFNFFYNGYFQENKYNAKIEIDNDQPISQETQRNNQNQNTQNQNYTEYNTYENDYTQSSHEEDYIIDEKIGRAHV